MGRTRYPCPFCFFLLAIENCIRFIFAREPVASAEDNNCNGANSNRRNRLAIVRTNCTLGRGCRWRGGGENGWWETAGEEKDAPRTRIVYRMRRKRWEASSLARSCSFDHHFGCITARKPLLAEGAEIAKEKVSLSRYRSARINLPDDETLIARWRMITRARDPPARARWFTRWTWDPTVISSFPYG